MTPTRTFRQSKNHARCGRLLGVGLAAFALSGLVAVDPIDPPEAHAACPVNQDCDDWPDPDPEPDPDPGPQRPHRPGNTSALVVAMGDSYASGEGSPERSGEWWGNGYSLDSKCHRSTLSATPRAVNSLSAASPYVEGIQYLNVACTGATIRSRDGYDRHYFKGGLLTGQGDMGKQAQFHQVNVAVGSRPIDALTISIGGNDVRFADIVKACGSDTSCNSYYGETATDLRWDLIDLRNLYSELITAVQGDAAGNGKALTAPVRHVFVTEYLDPTFDRDGTRCHNEGGWYLDKMTNIEAQWAKTNVVDKVNAEIRAMVSRANTANRGTVWHSVPAPSFNTHGFCSSDPWVHNYHTSNDIQHDHTATVHPNSAGWNELGKNLKTQLSYLNSVPYSM